VDTHQARAPTFSPTNTIINSNMVVVASLSTNAEIHYTTNGIDPTLSDPFVISGGLIQVTTGLTNKARAYRSDLTPSDVGWVIYTNKVANPSFMPSTGPISNGTSIAISSLTPNSSFYYTTNGTFPTTNSFLYSGSVVINGGVGVTLRAIGAASGLLRVPLRVPLTLWPR